jgi:hypothetical protein
MFRLCLGDHSHNYLVSVGKPPTGSKMHITVLR